MTMNDAENNGFTPSQVPKLLPLVNGKRVSERSVWRWMNAGLLDYARVGRRRWITTEMVQDFCRRTGRPQPQPSKVELATRLEAAREEYRRKWLS
jgi:hypothetical protein